MEKITLTKEQFINSVAPLLEAAGLDPDMAMDITTETFYDLSDSSSYYKSNVFLLAKALTHYRKNTLKQVWCKMPEKGSKDWDSLTKLAMDIEGYLESSYSSMRMAFKDVVKAIFEASPKLKDKFIYPYLQSMGESIIAILSMKKEISDDPNYEMSNQLLELYSKAIFSQTGMPYEPTTQSQAHFVRMAQFCKETKTDPKVFIDGAFDFLQYKHGIPKPENMLNEKFLIGIGSYKSGKALEPKVQKINLKSLKDSKW